MMMSCCPILNEYNEDILPVLEWSYACRAGLNMRGKPNQQL